MTQTPDRSEEGSPLETVEKQVASGELEAVEDVWMARLEKGSLDVSFFASVARILDRAGEGDSARFLLELLDDHLTENGEWQTRLDLLRRAGSLMIDDGELHRAIMETLGELYGRLPSYGQLVDKVGLNRAVDDLPKIWKKAQRLAGLLALDVGSIVYMDGKGAGRVAEVNMALESFKVIFEGDLEIRVGFGGATKLLEPLSPDHILHRKLVDPKALRKLRDEQPSELLRAVFESHDTPLTGAQIKRVLSGVVSDAKWSSWWAAARKHPQVIVAPGGKRAYAWAASTEDAQNVVWESFDNARPRTRMDLLRRDGSRDPELKSRMSLALAEQAADLAVKKPGLASEIWFTLERHGELPPAAEWSPRTRIAELQDPRPLFSGVKDRTFREQAYQLARDHRPDWPELFIQMLWQEHDPRCLDFLAGALEERAPQQVGTFLDQILSQPKRNPAAFVWLAERAAERPEWLGRNPIRLLKQILWALTDGDFTSFRASRLLPLAESGGTLPRLIAVLEAQQAAEAENAIGKATGLELYQRKPLINAIHLRFPDLRQEEEVPLYATAEKIDAKRVELKKLAEVEIPANRKAIEEARELGDLSENFEYKSARQRHEYLAARAAKLNHDLNRVRRIDVSQVTGEEVVIGSKVRLAAEDSERTITILGPWESEPEKGVLSSESDMAQTLLGLKTGDQVELAGTSYRVEAVEPYV